MMNDMSGSTKLTPQVGERDHIEGGSNAFVTLVEYGDFECPDCGVAYPIVKELQKRMGEQLRFVFRNYPLPQHPHAAAAAEAAEAAGAQGKFWEMHDLLFEHQRELDNHHLQGYARSLGLDIERFLHDMARHTYAERIEEDIESGDASGVEGTPTFFINDKFYDQSYDLETLQAALTKSSDI